jgi:hypothetical protein
MRGRHPFVSSQGHCQYREIATPTNPTSPIHSKSGVANTVTDSELQEEAGILSVACGQLGQDLAHGRLNVLENVHRQLSAILSKWHKPQAIGMSGQMQNAKANGKDEEDSVQVMRSGSRRRSSITGASLIASGRVPRTTATFIEQPCEG